MRHRHLLLIYAFVFFVLNVSGQKNKDGFLKEWVIIDSLIYNSNLTKSALEKVNAIYIAAKATKQSDQVLKALLYQLSLDNKITDKDVDFTVIEQEIEQTKDSVQRAILQAILAKNYFRYYESVRWEILGRNKNAGAKNSSIHTWTTHDFQEKITGIFNDALINKNLLQSISINKFPSVIKGYQQSFNTYSVFDLLGMEAINYFKEVYNLEINNDDKDLLNAGASLDTIDRFLKFDFNQFDSTKSAWKVISLYQQLLKIHQRDLDQSFFVQLNIERIVWANKLLQVKAKDELYDRALNEMQQNYAKVPSSIYAWYLKASLEKEKGDLYKPTMDSTNRYRYNSALFISEKAKQVFGEAQWNKSGLHNLNTSIHHKKIAPAVEKINAPGKPFRAYITYKNIDTLYAKIIRLENNVNKQYNNDLLKPLLSKQIIEEYMLALPITNDHQQHSVEIKINALSTGKYAIICSNTKHFKEQDDYIGISYFNVSNITYLKDNEHYFIRDYNSGTGVSNVQVNVYSSKYDYNSGTINYTLLRQLKSDANGAFNLKSSQQYGEQCVLEFIKGKDYLWADENEYLYNYEALHQQPSDSILYEAASKKMLFYTDRSIYRPNQLVYFKGISINKHYTTQFYQLNPIKDPIKVFLRDANYTKVDSLILVPNEFGSIAGSFNIKQGRLTGKYTIEAENHTQSTTSFSVEEYKRPNFVISFNNQTDAFQLNKEVNLTGSATAFAGNVINLAAVRYTVKQISINPLNELKRIYFPTQEGKIIAEGKTITNDKGVFIVPFNTSIELLDSLTELISVNYSITVSITDINGETISNSTYITAANYAGKVSIAPSGVLEKKEFNAITSNFLNHHDIPQKATITIRLQKAVVPEKMMKARYWNKPDQFVLSPTAYAAYFPNDEYADERDYKSWEYHTIPLSDSIINNQLSTRLSIDNALIGAGVYRIEATTIDSFGKKIVANEYVMVYDHHKKTLPKPSYDFAVRATYEAQPGDSVRLLHLSSIPSTAIIRKIKRGINGTEVYSYLNLKKMDETVFAISEKDRGGIIVTDAYVYAGRIYTRQYQINVPWTNKQLHIKYGSYKNMVEPGSKEKYTVEVTGADGTNKLAELLCGMYDASLDKLTPHEWQLPNLWEQQILGNMISSSLFTSAPNREYYPDEHYKEIEVFSYPELLSTGEEIWDQSNMVWINDTVINVRIRMKPKKSALNEVVYMGNRRKSTKFFASASVALDKAINEGTVRQEESYDKVFTPVDITNPKNRESVINSSRITNKKEEIETILIRKDFKETAFFYPQLHADSSGKFSFEFTLPDAVTQWKWMSVAHSKDLSMGKQMATIITQKKLMVQPNMPRFFREGDQLELVTKIANLSDKELTGTVSLALIDPSTNQSVDGWFQNVFPQQYFTAEAGKSIAIQFPIQIPFSYNKPLIWKIVATSGNYFDGVENTLPVLSKRQLVTESLPIFLPKDTVQNFVLETLKNQQSESVSPVSLTVEYTSQPVWNVVKAIPYLIEDGHENIVQQFNRFYANSMATYLFERNPEILQIFKRWEKDTSALINHLEKNAALKQVFIQETPWVIDAQSQRIQLDQLVAQLNTENIKEDNEKYIQLLESMQLNNGAFPWSKGGYENDYITQYILTGIGKLNRLGALPNPTLLRLKPLLLKALNYLDDRMIRDYTERKKSKTPLDQQALNGWHIEQLYVRSYFNNLQPKDAKIQQYYLQQGKRYWTKLNTYYQAMLAIVSYRTGDVNFSIQKVLPALLENTVQNSKQGMYWKNTITRYWYNSSIIHQCMMIDCFNEINQSLKSYTYTQAINQMRTWLILQKQTNYWESAIATTDACYSILQSGTNWLNSQRNVYIQLGSLQITNKQDTTATAGTGYFSKRIAGELVKPEMGTVSIRTITPLLQKNQENNQPSYGAIYWQYLEDMDKINMTAGLLSIQKNILVANNQAKEKIWIPLKENEPIKVGQQVTVQLIIQAERDMEYVHVKDLRASGMEPLNVLSGYKWQNRIGYYESTKDVSSEFYIDYLPKGTYVIEYDLVATHEGVFSAGNASVQCMYAPEFVGNATGKIIRISQQ